MKRTLIVIAILTLAAVVHAEEARRFALVIGRRCRGFTAEDAEERRKESQAICVICVICGKILRVLGLLTVDCRLLTVDCKARYA